MEFYKLFCCTKLKKKFSGKGGELYRLRFKYTWVHVQVHRSELARRGVLEHKLSRTWVETAQGALALVCKNLNLNFHLFFLDTAFYNKKIALPNIFKIASWKLCSRPGGWATTVTVKGNFLRVSALTGTWALMNRRKFQNPPKLENLMRKRFYAENFSHLSFRKK